MPTSEMGHSRRFYDVRAMSGLPPIATELRTSLEVWFVPLAAVSNHSNQTPFVVGTTPPAQIVHVGTSRPSVLAVLRHERQRPPEPPPLS